MKRLGCIFLFLLIAVPAWPAKKITVEQLQDLLKQLHAQNKSDQQIAVALKQVQLSEELTRSEMNDLAEYAPGPETTEQIYVLEAGSAVLAPPASDIPKDPPLDMAAQKTLLEKANDYVTKTYSQLPALTATKTTVRFQDNVEAPASSSGQVGGAADVTAGSIMGNPSQYIRYLGSTEVKVASANGVERPAAKEKGDRWGANGRIALFGPAPNLSMVLRDAQESGSLTFLRWETINGKAAAVFSFAVPKKKSHYAVDYCCFPNVSAAGDTGVRVAGDAGGASQLSGAATAGGSFQTATDWHDFTAKSVPYHGELFINPDTGIVVRMVTIAEFKNSDLVHQEDRRTDYLPVTVGDKGLILPVRTMINTEVVPSGESGSAGRFTTRRTMLTSEYKDFQLSAS
jgi:hypothetical protein